MRLPNNLIKLHKIAKLAGRNGFKIEHTDCSCTWLQKLVWEHGYYAGLAEGLVKWLLERKKSNG